MGRKGFNIALVVFIVFCLALIFYGCGRPPTEELADAEAALSAAKVAGAEIFATNEYESAESKLEKARKEAEGYHYTKARQLALDAKDQALLAKKIAEGEKAKLRERASQAIKDAKEAMIAAEAAGAKTHDPEGYRSAESLLGEAEMAYGGEQYTIAIKKAEEAKQMARRLELAAQRGSDIQKVEKEAQPSDKMMQPPSKIYAQHVVQKGECLWIISEYEKVYGNPFMWPLIYKENRSQIKDPDLIFPKQNFKIPRDSDPKDVKSAIDQAKNRGPWSLFDGK